MSQIRDDITKGLRKLRPTRVHESGGTISIVIPAYNEEKYLAFCLESLNRARTADVIEVIVVDNASTDGTAEVARRFKGVTVVSEPNKGVQRARQTGFQNATGELLAYIDADTRVPRRWCRKIGKEFSKDPTLVCLSGPYFYFDIPRWQRAAVRFYWQCLAVPTYRITKYMVVGGNFVVRREALAKINGFDTSIEFYGDDTNIARRISKLGRVRFSGRFVMHTSGRRLKKQGIFKTGAIYMANFVSEALVNKPFTREYEDIR